MTSSKHWTPAWNPPWTPPSSLLPLFEGSAVRGLPRGVLVPAATFVLLAAASALVVPAEASAQAGDQAAGQATEIEPPPEPAFDWNVLDPRIGLEAGWLDAESAIWNLEHVASQPRPEGFYDPADPLGSASFWNTDLGFKGDNLFQGSYNGFLVYNISESGTPSLEVEAVCPGGQGDVSVYRDLLFMSAQESRGRVDCGSQGIQDSVSTARFQGVRIFDISDVRSPRQIAAVQTCRGSHTHTLLVPPDDDENVYVYVSGTSGVRPAAELPGCSELPPDEDPNTSYFRIEVIEVPLDSPEDARIVSMPRLFADEATGDVAGLWQGGDHGEGTQETRQTNQCHDITVYPEFGIAGGACSGNGILLDITDPVNPVRLDEVVDPNFAYWHSATFNNDGTKILFTDEWGGGTQPRCLATDPPTWGANAIFEIVDGALVPAGYYKLPVPQTETENCVAHNGSMIPVPGRDIMVQAWYQGGLSVFDFTDPANAYEIAYFDRGPLSAEEIHVGGFWSTYWYNGAIYAAEIARGIDVFELAPSEHLSENEIEAAKLVRLDVMNAQHQPVFDWPASVVVSAAYLDQLERSRDIPPALLAQARSALAQAESTPGSTVAEALDELADEVEEQADEVAAGEELGDEAKLRAFASSLRELEAGMD